MLSGFPNEDVGEQAACWPTLADAASV